jgi:hypothetical protein
MQAASCIAATTKIAAIAEIAEIIVEIAARKIKLSSCTPRCPCIDQNPTKLVGLQGPCFDRD